MAALWCLSHTNAGKEWRDQGGAQQLWPVFPLFLRTGSRLETSYAKFCRCAAQAVHVDLHTRGLGEGCLHQLQQQTVGASGGIHLGLLQFAAAAAGAGERKSCWLD